MESLSQHEAEVPFHPPDTGHTDRDKVKDYLNFTLSELRRQTDILLKRYQEAGIKWHLIPFTVRISPQLNPNYIDMLDEVFAVDPQDGKLAKTVEEAFSDLVSDIVDGQAALDDGDEHLAAAQEFVDDAVYEGAKLDTKITVTEAAVEDVIAVRNAMDEQDLLPSPEWFLDVKLGCFEDWLAALVEAEQEWILMKT